MSLPLCYLYIVFLTIIPETSGFLVSVVQVIVVSSLIDKLVTVTTFTIQARITSFI